MLLKGFFILFIIFVTPGISHGEMNTCVQKTLIQLFNPYKHFMPKSIEIEAPQKLIRFQDSKNVLSEAGSYQVYKLNGNGQFEWKTYTGEKIIPNKNTEIGRYADQMSKKGINVYFGDAELSERNSGGYSISNFQFYSSTQGTTTGAAIVLPREMMGNRYFNSIIGHEAFHGIAAKNRLNNGAVSIFDGKIRAEKGINITSEEKSIYNKFMNFEEIHTYAKDLAQTATTAHARETMLNIEKAKAKLPKNLSDSEKLNRIHLTTSSVLNEERVDKGVQYLETVLSSTHSNVNLTDISELSELNVREQKIIDKPSNYELSVKNNLGIYSNIRISEAEYKSLLNEKGLVDQQKFLTLYQLRTQKLDALVLKLQEKLDSIKNGIESARKKGYFTANEYIQFKKDLNELAGSVSNKNEVK